MFTAPVARVAALMAFAAPVLAGCLPYAVGSTADTTPTGELRRQSTVQFVPAAPDLDEDTYRGDDAGFAYVVADVEARFGLDEASDVGTGCPARAAAASATSAASRARRPGPQRWPCRWAPA